MFNPQALQSKIINPCTYSDMILIVVLSLSVYNVHILNLFIRFQNFTLIGRPMVMADQ